MAAPASSLITTVSGGNRSIGLPILRELLAHDWRVSVSDAYATYSADYVSPCHVYANDRQSKVSAVPSTVCDFDGFDAVVHIAVTFSTCSVIDADYSDVDLPLGVNVKSSFRLRRKACQHLLASNQDKMLVMLAAKRVQTVNASLYERLTSIRNQSLHESHLQRPAYRP